MEKVRAQAEAEGDTLMEALALTALGDASQAIRRHGRAQELIDRALELQENETDVDAHFDSLMARSAIGVMRGSMAEAMPYVEQSFAVALAAGRKDLQTIASQALAQAHIVRLEFDKAERLIHKARRAGRRKRQSSRKRSGAAHPWLPPPHAEGVRSGRGGL